MPLNRYQIRNEYSLADPDLYRVADKDDPEALLEGVAMSGLVGLLRQLGDLAEFAAEIFHDLHEEVMATAARGHSLIVRVQQLETEFPSVERRLLSQTSHTAFLYNSGVDWHSNLRVDQNLVTQGDLPRFVMDSYEECRGPPRLFLLDKFDVAGAGACLKRYTDPSFFKVEVTSSTGRKSEGPREKKTRKVKKRGQRRNGDTPETFPSTHAKLHQLFLEERIESGGNDPGRRVKLKKRHFTGSLFDQDKGKSYMEKFLDTCPPEQKIVHEICIDPLPLTWKSENDCESGLEIVEIGTVSPLKESVQTDRSSCSSPDTSKIMVKPSHDDISKEQLSQIIVSEAVGLPRFNHDNDTGEIPATICKAESDEEFAHRKSKSDVCADDGYNSEDVISEADNYMDALATIDSEVETDSESKKKLRYRNLKVDSNASERKRESRDLVSDSQSHENSVMSEDGNSSFKERESSSWSISEDTLAETTPDLDLALVGVPSVSASNADTDMSVDHPSVSEGIPGIHSKERAVGSTVASETDDAFESAQVLEEASSSSCLTDPNTMSLPVEKEASLRNNSPPSPGSDKADSNSAEPCDVSGMSERRHANHTGAWSCNETVTDDYHNKEGQISSLYSENVSDVSSSHGLVDLLQVESGKADSVSSSVEQHINDIGVVGMDSHSDIRLPLVNLPISDPHDPVAVKPVDAASSVDFFVSSTEQHFDSGSIQDCSIQDKHSETMNPGHMPPDFTAEDLPSSHEHPSFTEAFTNIEGEVKASSSPITMSSALQTLAFESSSSEVPDAAEMAERGLSEAATSVSPSWYKLGSEEVSASADVSPSLNPSEAQEQLQNLPSGRTVSALSENQLTETGERYSWSETSAEDRSVTISGDEYNSMVNVGLFGSDDIFNDVIPTKSDKELDATETASTQVSATGDRGDNDNHDFKNEAFSQTALLSDMHATVPGKSNFTSAIENNPDSLHLTKVDHVETEADGSVLDDSEDCYHKNKSLMSSSSLYPEKVQEPPVPLAKETGQNEEELAPVPGVELAAQNHVDLALDAHVNSNSMLSGGFPTCILPSSSMAEDVKHNRTRDVVEAPLTSNNVSQNPEASSSHQFHLSEGMKDNVGSVNHILGKATIPLGLPVLSSEPQINLDSPPLPPLPPMQWRLSRFQKLSAAPVRQMGQNTHSSVQLLGNLNGIRRDESLLSQNGSQISTNRHLAQQGTLTTPMPASFSEVSSQNNANGSGRYVLDGSLHNNMNGIRSEGNLSSQNGTQISENGYLAQQGVSTAPMPASVIEISSQNSANTTGREDNFSFTSPSVSARGQNGTAIPEEPTYEPILNPREPEPGMLSEGHVSGHIVAVEEAEVGAENGVQKEQIEKFPQVTEQEALNSHVQLLPPPSLVHNNLQPAPGFVAPEASRSWLSTIDDVPTNADGANGTLQKKPPRPRNPLIDEVVAIDKSKFRKVERVKPPMESKPEEGESIREQLKLRKVGERVKPQTETKVEEREFSLEQLQLRKVGERVKPQAEPKPEERDSPLEQLQLRKVGERVKQEIEQKPEETESPRVQLRKVRERVKPEIEQKPEETESPRVQLRKAGERAHLLAGPKTEDRDSLLEQIRNKTFSLKPAVAARPNIQPSLQGPRTNLKVAAILEKASNIRQAMVGSDEEDDADSWSDC